MNIEKGVEMIGVCTNLKRVLKIIDQVFYETGNHFLIIAAKWGKDVLRLAHESGHAIDAAFPYTNWPDILYKLKDVLGCNYTVRDMKSHLHIEYTPLGDRPLPHKPKGKKDEYLWGLRQNR